MVFSLKEKKNTQNTFGSHFLYPGEINLHTLLFKQSFAGLQTSGESGSVKECI